MARDELPPEVIDALATLLRYAQGLVRETLEARPEGNGPAFYDPKTAPMGRAAFLRLAREGAFKATRVGRKVLARKEDVDAWIEARAVAVPHRSTRPASAASSDLDGDRDAWELDAAIRAEASAQGRTLRKRGGQRR